MSYARVTAFGETTVGDLTELERFGETFSRLVVNGNEQLIPPHLLERVEYLSPIEMEMLQVAKPPLPMIQVAACKVTGVGMQDALSPKRSSNLVRCRWLGMMYARKVGYSMEEIGRAYQRDHGTVLHAEKADKPPEFETWMKRMDELLKPI